MESGIPNFNCDECESTNIGTRWEKWKRAFQLFLVTKEITCAKRCKAMLLHMAGMGVQEIYYSIPNCEVVTEGNDEFTQVIQVLDKYFLPKRNVPYERHVFRSLKQEINEPIDKFITRLRLQGKNCDYANLNEEIRDQIIENCSSNVPRRKLLEKGDITLTEVAELARALEATNIQLKVIEGNVVNAMKSAKGRKPIEDNCTENSCYRCGQKGHYARDKSCPARGKECNKCGLEGHFSKMCKTKIGSKTLKENFKKKKRVNQVESDNESDSDSYKSFSFGIINYMDKSGFLAFKVGGIKLSMMIDSGACCNLIDKKTWEDLKRQNINCESHQKGSDKKIYAYGSRSSLNILGTFVAKIQIGNCISSEDFVVVEESGIPLLGRTSAEKLGVLKIGVDIQAIELQEKYFDGVGKLKNFQLDLPVNSAITPVAQPLRKMPVLWKKCVEDKLNELILNDIIEEVHEPAAWVSPIVVIPKQNGDIRLCIDMRRANEAIEREKHPLPTIDYILPELQNCSHFSKLDIKSAFHQIELSPKSREVTTFITHKGLFRYKRLMFGITCAPEMFQKVLEQVLSRCEGVKNFIDDILIFGRNKQEHDLRLKKVLEEIENSGLTLNKSKCIVGAEQVEFMGHLLTKNGLTLTKSKVQDVHNFRQPETVEEVRSFLGLVNFVGRFIPNLSTINEPLRRLVRKNGKFVWTEEQEKSFQELKKRLTNAKTLGYFNPENRTQVVADASPFGVGAVLIQLCKDGPRVISYASKSLTAAERRYSQTEREALALVWACERFRIFLLGNEFDLITDHKPLEVIFGKRSKPCARIERWVLRLQSFRYKVVYKPGKSNIADPLSRLVKQKNEIFDEISETYVNQLVQALVPKAMSLEEIEKSSKEDNELKNVKYALISGDWHQVSRKYQFIKDELSHLGDVILRGTRIVIPDVLRSRVLKLAHEGHPGMVSMKQRLRSKVWWPEIDKEVEQTVRCCHGCQLVGRANPPEPLKKRQLPTGPWEELALDYMGPLPSGDYLFVIVDYFSRYFEVEIMKQITAEATIKSLKTIFARFGLPKSITADNGSQLVSKELRSYCEENNIKMLHVTPYWPQANGEVERQNATILKRLRISQANKQDWKDELLKFLMMYRTTPHTTTGISPGELMFGRKLRSKLPEIKDQQEDRYEGLRDRVKEKSFKEKEYTDKRRRAQESNLREGDMVLIRQPKKNKLTTPFHPLPLKLVEKKGNTVTLQSEDGKQIQRNTTFVKKYHLPEEFEQENQENNDSTPDVRHEDEPPPIRRSERMRRLPGKFKDYVL